MRWLPGFPAVFTCLVGPSVLFLGTEARAIVFDDGRVRLFDSGRSEIVVSGRTITFELEPSGLPGNF